MKCKKQECNNPVTIEGMAYCSRDCAPFGWYGIDREHFELCEAKRKRPLIKSYVKEQKSQRPAVSVSLKNMSNTPEWIKRWREKNR